jgi:hypothetical protein
MVRKFIAITQQEPLSRRSDGSMAVSNKISAGMARSMPKSKLSRPFKKRAAD